MLLFGANRAHLLLGTMLVAEPAEMKIYVPDTQVRLELSARKSKIRKR